MELIMFVLSIGIMLCSFILIFIEIKSFKLKIVLKVLDFTMVMILCALVDAYFVIGMGVFL